MRIFLQDLPPPNGPNGMTDDAYRTGPPIYLPPPGFRWWCLGRLEIGQVDKTDVSLANLGCFILLSGISKGLPSNLHEK